MHSVIDGQVPQNMFYSSLVTHFLQIGKILHKSVPRGTQKYYFWVPVGSKAVYGSIAWAFRGLQKQLFCDPVDFEDDVS